jgi:WD40 repeat protein
MIMTLHNTSNSSSSSSNNNDNNSNNDNMTDTTNYDWKKEDYEIICVSTLLDNNLDDEEQIVMRDANSVHAVGTLIQQQQQQQQQDIRMDQDSIQPQLPPSPAWHISFSRDGKFLATSHSSPENCIRIWSSSNAEQQRWNLVQKISGVQERTIRCTDFGPHYILASASFDGTICIWEPTISLASTTTNNNSSSTTSPKPDNFTTTTTTSSITAWECTTQLEGHENEVKSVAWNEEGTLLATCGRDKTVWVWECIWPTTSYYRANTLKNSNRTATTGAVGCGGDVVELDCLAVLNGHEADVKFVTFIHKPIPYYPSSSTTLQSPTTYDFIGAGGEFLISTSYDNTIKIWEEDDEEGEWHCVSTLTGHANTVWCVSPYSMAATITPNTNTHGALYLVSASHDSTLKLWEYHYRIPNEHLVTKSAIQHDTSTDESEPWICVATHNQAHIGAVFSVTCCSSSLLGFHQQKQQQQLSPWIASGGEDNCINIYHVNNNNNNNNNIHVPPSSKDGTVKDIVIHPKEEEGRTFTRLFHISNAHDGDVNCVRWHPKDCSLLASAGDDGIVRLWKVRQRTAKE